MSCYKCATKFRLFNKEVSLSKTSFKCAVQLILRTIELLSKRSVATTAVTRFVRNAAIKRQLCRKKT